ncbi:MAG: hypothetical protein R3F56_11660 [Planctomycetota bacterium]
MARASSRRGKLALRLGLIAGLATLLASMALMLVLVQTLGGAVDRPAERELLSRAWILGPIVSAIAAIVVGGVGFAMGSGIASRLTDLGLAVNKLGRAATVVRVRSSGDDEVTSLGTSIQHLANDLSAMFGEQEQAGTLQAGFDPQVRALRDRALPTDGLAAFDGFEVDAALANGSRGGLDYFGSSDKSAAGVLYLVSAEGTGALSIYACRLARDELQRALDTGASARKALAHTNRVLHRVLPPTVCAKASLLELADDEIKLYQAGVRTPALLCTAGTVEDVVADGLALGLDEGPVFEKQLRSTRIPLAQGVRVVIVNDAGGRHEDLRALVREHSPKNTAAFMNMVLGALEDAAGAEGLREEIALVTAKRW